MQRTARTVQSLEKKLRKNRALTFSAFSASTIVSFFVRAHNNVNQHTHPCRPRFTIKQGYDTYQEE